jgi:uncharacterized protein YbjT (DUF2867 family)
MTEKLTALVFGATGLVGGYLVEELLKHPGYGKIKVFGRGEYNVTDPRIEYHKIDFETLDNSGSLIMGDDLFICLGTTIRKAGSVAAVERIDRDYPAMISRIAAANGVKRMAVVSSLGSNAGSRNFYVRIKGQMEEAVLKAGIPKTVIARPSMLLGNRKEFRFGELVGKGVMWLINPITPGKYKGIHGRTVARAMINLLEQAGSQQVFDSDKLHKAGA